MLIVMPMAAALLVVVVMLLVMVVMLLVMTAMLIVPIRHGLTVDVMHYDRFPIDTLYHHWPGCVGAMPPDRLPLAVVGGGNGGSGGATEGASENCTRATIDLGSYEGTQGASQRATQYGVGGKAIGKSRCG